MFWSDRTCKEFAYGKIANATEDEIYRSSCKMEHIKRLELL